MFEFIKRYLQDYLDGKKDERLYKAFGYGCKRNFDKVAQKFLGYESWLEWFYKGHYDFTHNALSFAKQCECFANAEILKAELHKAQREFAQYKTLKKAFVRIKTDFRRKSEPIHILAMMQGMLYLSFEDKNLLFYNDKEFIQYVQNYIKEHCIKHGGKLFMWGNITGYVLHFKGKEVHFDTTGQIITDLSTVKDTHPRASLSVGGKTICDVKEAKRLTMQNNFLEAKTSIKVHSFAEALLHSSRFSIKLKDCTTLDELKTLAISRLKEHFALNEVSYGKYIEFYELHSSLLGEKPIFFNTQGEEITLKPKNPKA